jgi:hypothetical protein
LATDTARRLEAALRIVSGGEVPGVKRHAAAG